MLCDKFYGVKWELYWETTMTRVDVNPVAALGAVSAATQRTIALLKKRRAALIVAAVTRKISVFNALSSKQSH
jgi:hypothetical protein